MELTDVKTAPTNIKYERKNINIICNGLPEYFLHICIWSTKISTNTNTPTNASMKLVLFLYVHIVECGSTMPLVFLPAEG